MGHAILQQPMLEMPIQLEAGEFAHEASFDLDGEVAVQIVPGATHEEMEELQTLVAAIRTRAPVGDGLEASATRGDEFANREFSSEYWQIEYELICPDTPPALRPPKN